MILKEEMDLKQEQVAKDTAGVFDLENLPEQNFVNQIRNREGAASGNFTKKEPKKVTAALAFGSRQPGLVSEKSIESRQETETEKRDKRSKH